MHAPIKRDLPIPVVISKQNDGKSNSLSTDIVCGAWQFSDAIFSASAFELVLYSILELIASKYCSASY